MLEAGKAQVYPELYETLVEFDSSSPSLARSSAS